MNNNNRNIELKEAYELFPDEIWLEILGYLLPLELLQTSLVTRYFHKLSNDNRIWNVLCGILFKNKFTKFILQRAPLPENKMNLYFFAKRDSKRTQITQEELVSLGWQFEFSNMSSFLFQTQDGLSYFIYFPIYTKKHYINEGTGFMNTYKISKKGTEIHIVGDPIMYLTRNSLDWGWIQFTSYLKIYSFTERREEVPSRLIDRIDFAQKHNELGVLLFNQNLYFEAKQEFQKGLMAVAHSSDIQTEYRGKGKEIFMELVVNVGRTEMQLNQVPNAYCNFHFVLQPGNDPDHIRALEEMVLCCIVLRKIKAGKTYTCRLHSLKPDEEKYQKLKLEIEKLEPSDESTTTDFNSERLAILIDNPQNHDDQEDDNEDELQIDGYFSEGNSNQSQ